MSLKERIRRFVSDRIEKNMGKSRRKHGKDVTYTLWWWLGRNIQDKNHIRYVCFKIASYLGKTKEELDFAGITDIVVLGDKVFIYLKRPGILIGKGGSRIEKIIEEINHEYNYNTGEREKTHNYDISLIEDMSSGYATVLAGLRHLECELWMPM